MGLASCKVNSCFVSGHAAFIAFWGGISVCMVWNEPTGKISSGEKENNSLFDLAT